MRRISKIFNQIFNKIPIKKKIRKILSIQIRNILIKNNQLQKMHNLVAKYLTKS